jgi:hypothetical protein
MAHHAILVIFVLSGEVADPGTSALAAAAREVLGAGSDVRIEAMNASPGADKLDDEGAVSSAADATGILELTWNSTHTRAALHVYVAKDGRWLDRVVAFSPVDERTERGRMLGFAVAGMLLEPESSPEEPEAPAPRPRAPRPAVFSARRVPAHAPQPETVPRSEAPLRHSIGLSALATSGIAGYGNGFGASADVRLQASSVVWVRLALSAASGEVPPAQATARSAFASAGLALELLGRAPDSQWGLAARLDAGALWLRVTHLSEDDPDPVPQNRWLFAADALLEGTRRLSGSIVILGAAGAQVSSGRTFIYTHGERAAVVPLAKVLMELGVGARF